MPIIKLAGQMYVPSMAVEAWKEILIEGSGPILDYGAGNLRNARYLEKCGATVWAVDLESQINRIAQKLEGRIPEVSRVGVVHEVQDKWQLFYAAICTYVLNIVSAATRDRIAGIISNCLGEPGFFCVEVRKTTPGCGNHTLSQQELCSLICPHGFYLVDEIVGRTYIAQLYKKTIR